MARALSKVQKKISKKRGGGKLNTLHENSRDSNRLRSAGMREEKIAKLLRAAKGANAVYVDRVEWFREAIVESLSEEAQAADEDGHDLTDEDLHDLISRFITRLIPELEAIRSERRPGRPPSSLESQLQSRIENETKEYSSGLWTPDVRDKEARQKLMTWNGTWAGMNTLKFVRVVKDGGIRLSSFPPKGLS